MKRQDTTVSESQLRKVFNAFDVDGSGAVSTEEMTAMIRQLKLSWSAAKIDALMKEADPDGSGEIEYPEFASVLRKQLRTGGGLADVTTEASGAFGWLNPLSWFGGEEEAPPRTKGKGGKGGGAPSPVRKPPSPKPAPAAKPDPVIPPNIKVPPPKSPAKSPARPASAAKRSASTRATSPPVRRTTSGGSSGLSSRSMRSTTSLSPTHRLKKTQQAVVEVNLQEAADMRAEQAAKKEWFRQQREEFLEAQREKVEKGKQQTIERAEAIDALKKVKREVGSVIKQRLEHKWQEEIVRKKAFVEKSHGVVFEARKKKQKAVTDRKKYERENAIAIGEAAKALRAERREEAKATVRLQEQAARDFTARVRYETRPEVRQESSSLFQHQRDAAAEAARQKQEIERAQVKEQRAAYLQMASQVKDKVAGLHAASKASQLALKESRKTDAWQVRSSLDDEYQRKMRNEEQSRQNRQYMHDQILEWKVHSVVEPDDEQEL